METKANTGAIFKNDNKSDGAPDYKGSINVDGVMKDIALWLRTSKDGTKKYFSVSISEPYRKPEPDTGAKLKTWN